MIYITEDAPKIAIIGPAKNVSAGTRFQLYDLFNICIIINNIYIGSKITVFRRQL